MNFSARTLVEAVPGPAAIVDPDGRVLVANGRWARPDSGSAYPPEGAVLAASADPCPGHGQLLSAVREMTSQAAPTVLPCRCDAAAEATVRITHLESDRGSHRRLVTVQRATAAAGDIPDADAAAQAKSQFLALLGHEIRTPVTTVVATVDVLRAQQLPQHVREIVDSVHRSVHALKALTDDMLDLARLETGSLHLERKPVVLRQVFEGIVEPLQQQSRRKGILLLATPAPDFPAAVLGDINRLRQVLTCVVGNAVKFTEAGEVVVTAEHDGEDAYLITVSDTGPGIGEAGRQRIFAPFVQADSSAARRHEGAGLGLALAARLVECMGGTIEVRSEPGEGSQFLIRLPLEAAPQPPVVTPLPLIRRRIAVVAPTPRSALALSWLLSGAGAEPVPARFEDLLRRVPGVDTVLWCDDSHDPEVIRRADAIAEALGPKRRTLMISATDPRTGIVRRPGVLTAPLVVRRLVAALNLERTGVRGAPITVPPLAGGRVLLAEDNDVNRTVFRRMIQLLGVECDGVADGSAAVDALLGDIPYDVVLMDLQMPRTDGLEATRQVRAAGCATPILALTATALHGDRERCLEAGMDGHLSKPITLPELRAALEPYLSGPPDEPEEAGQAAAEADVPDLSKLRDLEEQLEDRGLVVTTVNTFLSQLDGRRSALLEALRRLDHDALRKTAHTLKSSSAMLGAGALADACAQVERNATADATEKELKALVAGVENAVAGAVRVMAGYLADDEEGADDAGQR